MSSNCIAAGIADLVRCQLHFLVGIHLIFLVVVVVVARAVVVVLCVHAFYFLMRMSNPKSLLISHSLAVFLSLLCYV